MVIYIQHNDNFSSVCEHLLCFNDQLKHGSCGEKGELIGDVGMTGDATRLPSTLRIPCQWTTQGFANRRAVRSKSNTFSLSQGLFGTTPKDCETTWNNAGLVANSS